MKQHALDPISLVSGVLFAIVGSFLIVSDVRWESAGGAWVVPAVLVTAGAAIIWSTVMRLRREEATETAASEATGDYSIPELDEN